MSEPNKIIKYTGYYKDVFFEINQIFRPSLKRPSLKIDSYIDNFYWTYYIFIDIDKIPKKYNPNSFWLPLETYEYGTLNNIYFYSGITFYSKVSGLEEGQKKIIKVGCDFNHLWDLERGYAYSYEDIYSHVTKTIHSLFDQIPEYGVEL